MNWILTFDDGPLPADMWDYDPGTPEALLDPLRQLLDVLARHPKGPLRAIFYLRGPGYPWEKKGLPRPPDSLFQKGIQLMLQAGHVVGLHCYTHDPDLWFAWPVTGPEIQEDLDRCVDYFAVVATGQSLHLIRPPYGEGDGYVTNWAKQNQRREHLWSIDSEDWRHHPDALPFPMFEDDPQSHLNHIRDVLDWQIATYAPSDDDNDILMHVSKRTSGYLGTIIDTIVNDTLARSAEATFQVTDTYLNGVSARPRGMAVAPMPAVPTGTDPLIARFRNAYADFCAKATPVQRAQVDEVIRQADEHAHARIVPPTGAPRVCRELVHARSALSVGGPRRLAGLHAQRSILGPFVMTDGEISGFGKYETLDIGWTEAGAVWLENYFLPPAKFGIDAPLDPIPAMPEKTTIALAGDWGAEPTWKPSASVARAIAAVQPDYTIHLGDVYYVGSDSAEQNNLVNTWPRGKKASFALNSNHEMYTGGQGLFGTAYRQDFNLNSVTELPTFTSFFALQNSNWVVVGLDSAYAADKSKLYLDGRLNQVQLDWLKRISGMANGRKIVVLSHHHGLDESGVRQGLWNEVRGALGDGPAYWYWGHIHNAIVYKAADGINPRCAGHGCIPYGDASSLLKPLQESGLIVWYETQSANDPAIPLRVLNGFVVLELDGPKMVESFIAENGEVRWKSP